MLSQLTSFLGINPSAKIEGTSSAAATAEDFANVFAETGDFQSDARGEALDHAVTPQPDLEQAESDGETVTDVEGEAEWSDSDHADFIQSESHREATAFGFGDQSADQSPVQAPGGPLAAVSVASAVARHGGRSADMEDGEHGSQGVPASRVETNPTQLQSTTDSAEEPHKDPAPSDHLLQAKSQLGWPVGALPVKKEGADNHAQQFDAPEPPDQNARSNAALDLISAQTTKRIDTQHDGGSGSQYMGATPNQSTGDLPGTDGGEMIAEPKNVNFPKTASGQRTDAKVASTPEIMRNGAALLADVKNGTLPKPVEAHSAPAAVMPNAVAEPEGLEKASGTRLLQDALGADGNSATMKPEPASSRVAEIPIFASLRNGRPNLLANRDLVSSGTPAGSDKVAQRFETTPFPKDAAPTESQGRERLAAPDIGVAAKGPDGHPATIQANGGTGAASGQKMALRNNLLAGQNASHEFAAQRADSSQLGQSSQQADDVFSASIHLNREIRAAGAVGAVTQVPTQAASDRSWSEVPPVVFSTRRRQVETTPRDLQNAGDTGATGRGSSADAGTLTKTSVPASLLSASPNTPFAVVEMTGRDAETPLFPAEADDDLSGVLITGVSGASGSASGTTPVTANGQPMASRSDHVQIVRQVSDSFSKMADGTVEVRLSPEELGHVRMYLTRGEHGLTVNIQADRPETLDMMRRNIDELARNLAEAGYEGAGFSFGEEQSSGQETPHRSNGTDMPEPDAPENRAMPVTAQDGLDIRI